MARLGRATSGASGFRLTPCGGEVRAEIGDDIGQSALEGVELAPRHLGEERARERSVVALEFARKPFPFCGEGHEGRATVGGMEFPCHEAAVCERVHESGDRPWRHLERVGEDALGHRPALTELPKQMRPGWCEVERLDRLRHVVVQQNDELEHAIECDLILLYLLYSEA
jgi:hypothetical protein